MEIENVLRDLCEKVGKTDGKVDLLIGEMKEMRSELKECMSCIEEQKSDTNEASMKASVADAKAEGAHTRVSTLWAVIIPVIIAVSGAVGFVCVELFRHLGGK